MATIDVSVFADAAIRWWFLTQSGASVEIVLDPFGLDGTAMSRAEGVPAGEARGGSQLFLDAEELVVLRDPLTA